MDPYAELSDFDFTTFTNETPLPSPITDAYLAELLNVEITKMANYGTDSIAAVGNVPATQEEFQYASSPTHGDVQSAQPHTPPEQIEASSSILQSPYVSTILKSHAEAAARPYASPYGSPNKGNTPSPPPGPYVNPYAAKTPSPLTRQHSSPYTADTIVHATNTSGTASPEEINTFNNILPSRNSAVLHADTAHRRRIASGTAQPGDEDADMFIQRQHGLQQQQQQGPAHITFDRNPADYPQHQAIIEELGMSRDSPQAKAMLNTVQRWTAEHIYIDPEKLKSASPLMQNLNNNPAHLQARRDVEHYKSLVLAGKRNEAQHHLEQMVLQMQGPRAMEIYMEWVQMGEEARARLGERYIKPTDVFVFSGPPCPVSMDDHSEAALAAKTRWYAEYKDKYALIDSQILLMREASVAYQQAVTFNASAGFRELASVPYVPGHLQGEYGKPVRKGKAKGKRKAVAVAVAGGGYSPSSSPSPPTPTRVMKRVRSTTKSPEAPALEGAVRELTSVMKTLQAEVMILKGEVALFKSLN